MTSWRNANRKFFLTQFNATTQRTVSWLRSAILSDSSRAFFVISDANCVRVGHLGVKGLDSEAPELDNMIRGRSSGDPKLMYWAEVSLIAWVLEVARAESICLQIFSNNWIPISIHQSIGFHPGVCRRLSRRRVGDEVHMLVDSKEGVPQRFGYLRMVLEKSNFAEHFPGMVS